MHPLNNPMFANFAPIFVETRLCTSGPNKEGGLWPDKGCLLQWQIGQIGRLENVGAANWAPGKLVH